MTDPNTLLDEDKESHRQQRLQDAIIKKQEREWQRKRWKLMQQEFNLIESVKTSRRTNMAKKSKGISEKKASKPKVQKEARVTKKSLVIEGQKKGMTVEEISVHSGATVNSVRWYLSKEGLTAKAAERAPKSE